jgi:ATP-dependent DNA ligase
VVDAEIVIAAGDKLDFEALLQRIHPAKSRVDLLAEQTPASLVVFDLLALGDESYLDTPLGERRRSSTRCCAHGQPGAPHQRDRRPGAGPGVVRHVRGRRAGRRRRQAGRRPYEPDKRTMFKIKHERTADCVVAGFRWHKTSTPEQPLLGSLLLGLYADDGRLQHVGVVASFPAKRRAELVEELAPWRENALDGHPWRDWAEAQAQFEGRMPGAQSRWNAKKDLSWEPLRAERVVEVRYDHMEGTRFRHTTQFVRWRTTAIRPPARTSSSRCRLVRPVQPALLARAGCPRMA